MSVELFRFIVEMLGFIKRFIRAHKGDDFILQRDLPLANRFVHLSEAQNDYAIELCLRNPWLQNKSSQLEETIVQIVSKVSGADKLFKTLMNRFRYVSKAESDKKVQMLIRQIDELWKVPKETTVIMAVCKNSHGDGSQALLNDLKRDMHDWRENRFYGQFDLENERIKKGYNVILIDDFVGSGETMGKRIEALKSIVAADAKIYVVGLGATKVSRQFLNNYYPQVAFYSPDYVRRGFDPKASPKKKSIMLKMEDLLAPKYKGDDYELNKFSLGYNKSCAVYYNEDYRTPNNVFPVFWWGKLKTGDKFNSLFIRT